MTEKTTTVQERFEAWHDRFYGPQDPHNPIRSLARFPEHMGLGYIDSVVQAQEVAFEGGMQAQAEQAQIARDDDDYLPAGILEAAMHGERVDAVGMARAALEQPPRAILRDDDMVPVPRGLLGACLHAIRKQVEAPELLARLREYAYSRVQASSAVAARPGQVPECFRLLLKHAHGMTTGVDWNKGTAAGYHRKPLGEAVVQCQAWLAVTPQPAASASQIPTPIRQFIDMQTMCSDCHLDETCCRPLLRECKQVLAELQPTNKDDDHA